MTEEHISKLKDFIHNLHLENSYGTLQVSYGCKQKDGIYAEEKCIRFGVENKIPIDQIPEDKRIPKTIIVDGIEYKTDVYVAPKNITVATAMRKIDFEEINTGEANSNQFFIQTVTSCNDTGSNSVPPVVSAPTSVNRATTRPLRGGISMANPPPTGYVNAGTLGVMVVDDFDGKLVGLTNNHVCTPPGGALGTTCKFFANDPNHSASYSKYNNINIYQQSSWDSGVVNKSSDLIGITKRAYPLKSSGTNYVDCGIVNLSDSIVDTNSWNSIGSSFGVTAPTFASTAEIDAITTSTQIFKTARTTGPIGPDNYSGCVIQITATTVSTSVGGYADSAPSTLSFGDLIEMQSSGTVVGKSGDSGSVVYAKIGGVWKIIGLYFAGNDDGSYGLACRIDRVASLLHISAYTGGSISANTGSRSYLTLDLATYGGQVSASIGGKNYWQVGNNP